MTKRPDCIKHYSEIQRPWPSRYPGTSDEWNVRGSPFGSVFGLQKLGIHHQVLEPGCRTSFPHAESHEEEFVYVLEGTPDAWIDGEIYRLAPGDGVGFPCGTGIAHTFLNNTATDVRLLVVGETEKPESRINYPLHLHRRDELGPFFWHDAPKRALGPHDGLPDELRAKRQASANKPR